MRLSPIKVKEDGFSFRLKDLETNEEYPFEYDGSIYEIIEDEHDNIKLSEIQ